MQPIRIIARMKIKYYRVTRRYSLRQARHLLKEAARATKEASELQQTLLNDPTWENIITVITVH